MRGKLCCRCRLISQLGITPACAGKTGGYIPAGCKIGDHPRVCGENALPLCKTLLDVGSPPRVRGKRISQMGGCGRRGITPACAGKTSSSCRTNPKSGDHPRVCGENILPWQVRIWNSGSPPRVRGKLFKPLYAVLLLWITPACAGKTCLPWRQDRPSWDHPRVCGENYKGRHRFGSFQGSPPRVRGKPWVNPLVTDVSGITPACAGKTHSFFPRSGTDRDHPRVCGENCSPVASKIFTWGSPPRVRGKPRGGEACRDIRGITPACAGKTQHVEVYRPGIRDHPRVCGENPRGSVPLGPIVGSPRVCGENGNAHREHVTNSGSPPRVRGKLQ